MLIRDKMKTKRELTIFVSLLFFIVLFFIGGKKYQERLAGHSGIPDVINSTVFQDEQHLIVLANQNDIPDKEAFARKIIQMYQDNSFRSIRFSTDVDGYPLEMDISVYLKQGDIGKKEPFCKIRYEALERKNTVNSMDRDSKQFRLYLDDREIE